MTTLIDLQKQAGAVFRDGDKTPSTFNQDSQLINGKEEQVILCDRSDWGLLKLTGDDRARFLHNQTTNDIQTLGVGAGCETVFVNSTGRTIDLVTAYNQESAILLLVSPQQNETLYQWMDRYIFPFDKVQLADLTPEYSIFTVIGQSSGELLASLLPSELLNGNEYSHQTVTIADVEVMVTVDCGLTNTGYNFIVPTEKAGIIWETLTGALTPVLIGEEGWQRLRIQEGRPQPATELTTDYNPLEAGLWRAISFDKGCYIGQETIARLNTYKGVKQRLWGIKLSDRVSPQTPITVDDKKIGILTSYIDTAEGGFGLAYIKTKAGGVGLNVRVGAAEGILTDVPFLKHEYPTS